MLARRALLQAAASLVPGLLLPACVARPGWTGSSPTGVPRPPSPPPPSTTAPPAPPASSSQAAASPALPDPQPAPVPQLVPFTGLVQHLMTHPLIAYPSRAFTGPQAEGFNMWFITADEFDRLLPQLYANNYILIDPHLMVTETTVNGEVRVALNTQLLLPAGKKPLIFSFDDMNYYQYMQAGGTVDRLVLDTDGTVASYSVDLQGNAVISHSNAAVPILDRFVAEHPDFSFQGAKATINLTGYEGILGYRTDQTAASDYASVRAQAEAVVARLHATGWTFACHGWGHLNAQEISLATLQTDTQRWEQQVRPLLPPTDIYVYPFGADLLPQDPKFNYLLGQGFHVFWGVGPQPYLRVGEQWMAMDRLQIDGVSLEAEPSTLAPFFDASTVLDRKERGALNCVDHGPSLSCT